MELIFSILLACVGLAALVKGADWFVDGASALAYRNNIPPMVVGLTVVAFGTSLPELLVSVSAAAQNAPDLTISNIIGSNVANTLLILGVASIITPLVVQSRTVFKEIPFSLLAALVVAILGLAALINGTDQIPTVLNSGDVLGVLALSEGLMLLALGIIFIYYNFSLIQLGSHAETDTQHGELSYQKISLLIGLGIVCLGVGSTLTVDNALIVATQLGLSENLIGITLIAIGTSFPELVTSVIAALKKQGDLILGNVIGSNALNIFMILGISASITPLPISSFGGIDMMFLIIANLALLLTVFAFKRFQIGKVEGAILLLMYISYTGLVFYRDFAFM